MQLAGNVLSSVVLSNVEEKRREILQRGELARIKAWGLLAKSRDMA